MNKIDLVYLWFDPNDNDWRMQKEFWQRKIGINFGANRKIDWIENEELRYALRSADKFAPWINHIYIVTGFDQVPEWLDINKPNITIVPHSDIMPADCLPTFNSNAITKCIVDIPGLSEYFLLANDDTFFGAKCTPDYFFDKNGRPITWYVRNKKFSGNYDRDMKKERSLWKQHHIALFRLLYNAFGKKLHKYMPAHNISPYRKSHILECQKHPLMRAAIEKTKRNKFRTPDDVTCWIYSMYDYSNSRNKLRRAYPPKSPRHIFYNMWHKLRGSLKRSPQYHDSIKHLPKNLPVLFCVNSETTNNYAKIFPNKCRFEK